MQLHGPKRVYTRDSLEAWFNRLVQDWDGSFPAEHLAAGRELYRNGGIREIELTARDAIIHCRIEKKDEYSVLEWGPAGLVVRSSCTDTTLANSIAVAGLHEIEELVADELAVLPGEPGAAGVPSSPAEHGRNGAQPETPGAGIATGATGDDHPAATAPSEVQRRDATTSARRIVTASGGTGAAPATRGEARSSASRPRRDLLLKFRVIREGLLCEPWWIDASRSRSRALAQAAPKAAGNGQMPAGTGGNGHGQVGVAPPPNAAERMKLISLTALARKSHFHFQAELGAYVLGNVAEIPYFLKNVLPVWTRSFKIEQDPSVARLGNGVQAVQVEARARRRPDREGHEIDLEWIFRTGEQLLGEAELNDLRAANGGPVIVPEVGLVSLPAESMASLEQWRDATAGAGSGPLPPYLLFSLFNDQRCKLTLSPELEAWYSSLQAPAPERLQLPDFLRPYQRRGVAWLAHLCDHGCHALLADEMGLGKTVQVGALLATRPVPDHSHLVVCPASVVPVWQEELRRFFPHIRVFVLKNGHDFTTAREPGVWLASYAQLRNHRALLDEVEFGYAVLDEGQFIKNPDAKVTNTCFAIRARHRLVLTGTPLENRQLDLWSIFHFLLPGLLGTRASFEAALGRDREGTMERLRRQLAPFILRRTKAQVAQELPPKVEIDLLCPLTDLQRAEYARVCREGLARLGDDIGRAMREKAFGFLSLLTRLRQICCDPDLLPWLKAGPSASGKLGVLAERLGEVLSSGHKVVIFSQFVTFLERVHEVLAEKFPEVPRFTLTGATLDRQKPVQEFQNLDRPACMLVSLKAAGTGITLHAADYVFLLDPWWNPSVEEQAVDRVHRIGQTRTVFVYRMVTQGTIEERIQSLKAEKKQLFRRIIEGVSGDIDLSEHFSSLHQLIELAADAELVDAPDASDPGA